MKSIKRIFFIACAVILSAGLSQVKAQGTLTDGSKWHWDKGTIVIDSPERPAGQEHALNLVTPKLKVVRVGFVGLGMRGPGAVDRWSHIPGVQIVALCDHEKSRAEGCQGILKNAKMPEADIYYGEKGYEELCKRPDIDVVYIATDWIHHFLVAKCALQNGKHVAIEVPSAMNLKECWELVNLSEKNRLHCMLLENCCYDFFEMNTLNMAKQGVFGDILHVSGAYCHCLDPYWDAYWKKNKEDKLGWRLEFNMKHRGDIYSTHGLGPVAQLLDIHRGDRMKTLVAMDTKSVIGAALVKERTGQDVNFRNGDFTSTFVRTENGKMIRIDHDVMTPQPYDRKYQLVGTKGFANKYPNEGYALSTANLKSAGVTPKADNLSGHEYMSENDKKALVEKYQDPIIRKYGEMAKEVGGHGGMDFIMDSRFVYCLQNGLPLDIDVYDLAEWCCFAELGALSMDNNNASVQVPDFTRGHWSDNMGYKHAFATPENEAAAAKAAKEFTEGMKAGGKKFVDEYWANEAKSAEKAAKKSKK